MALATTCPQCKTSFKVVPDQLKLRRGLVRCGVCQHVFSGIDFLRHVDDAARAAARQARSADPSAEGGAGAAAAESAQGVVRIPRARSDSGEAPTPAEAQAERPVSSAPAGTNASLTDPPPQAAGSGGGKPDAAAPANSTDRIRSFDIGGSPDRPDTRTAEPGRTEPGRAEPRRDEPRRDEPRRDEPRRDEPRRDEPRRRGAGRPNALPDAPGLRIGPTAPDAPATRPDTIPPVFVSRMPAPPDASSGPRTVIDEDEDLKTAFFLTDSAFGPLPGDSAGPGTRIGAPDARAGTAAPGAASPRTPLSYASLPVLPFSDEPPPPPSDVAPPATPTLAAPAPSAPAPSAPAPSAPAPSAPAETAPGAAATRPGLPLRPERSPTSPDRTAVPSLRAPDASQPRNPRTLFGTDDATRHGPRTHFLPDDATRQGRNLPFPADASTRHGPRTHFLPDDATRHGPGTLSLPDETTRHGPQTRFAPELPATPHRPLPSARPAAESAARRERSAGSAIDYFSSGRRRSPSLGLALSPAAWLAAAILSLLLAVQAAVGWRDAIAARMPSLAPLLSATLAPFGWPIAPPRELGSLTIESFELQATGSPNRLRMIGVLRNGGTHAVAFPAIELTLTDSTGALLVRKVITADVYLADGPPAERTGERSPAPAGTSAAERAAGLSARSERPLRLVLEHDGLKPTGFSVALFHP